MIWKTVMDDESIRRMEEIGKRVHDGLSQKLSSASMNLSFLNSNESNLSDQGKRVLQETLQIVNESVVESRDLVSLLMEK